MNDLLRQNVSESAYENIQEWLTKPKYADYRSELEAMIEAQEWTALEDAFFKVIEFGTGGRRGVTGVGSNRINRITIGESAQALCAYAASFDPEAATKGVAIACDTRLSSPELSRFTAQVCAANGFKVYLFDGFRATPELSFAVRHLGAAIGIVISASHNPPADNGFKAYWSDGGQLVSPHDKGVLKVAASIEEIRVVDFDQAVADGSIEIISEAVDGAYVQAVVDEAEGVARELKIVYSPLHGAGSVSVLPVLEAAGFTSISTVEAQMAPDGNFPTVPGGKSNPEERAANDMAVEQMLAEEADIAITNDPDADRIGVMVRHGDRAIYLSGNQSAALAAEFSLRKLHERGELTPDHYIGKTIVTTDMMDVVAEKYGARVYGDMLIGFKYIGELILKKENTPEKFVIGGEESYGLLKGTYARDKDGAVGALLLAEYAAELKAEGKTLYDRLLELYEEHGVFVERLDTIVCPGASGFEQMQRIMSTLRSEPLAHIDDEQVTAFYDYKTLERLDTATGDTTPIDCVSGDVVVFEFGDRRRRITVRPSGTEPKLKFYVQWHAEAGADVAAQYETIERHIESLSRSLGETLLTY